MEITFGIITGLEKHDDKFPGNLGEICRSINQTVGKLSTQKYQIIIIYEKEQWSTVGDSFGWLYEWEKIGEVDFSVKPGWITAKKNYITEKSCFNVICYGHDYYAYGEDFYKGLLEYGAAGWDIMMTRISNKDGSRFRDYCAWDDPELFQGSFWVQSEKWCKNGRLTLSRPCLVPYNYDNKYWYISGGFWIAKRQFMLENPLDENLVHSEAEDVEFGLRVREKANYVMNINSSMNLLKQKDLIITEYK